MHEQLKKHMGLENRMVTIDIDKIETIEEIKAVLRVLVRALGNGTNDEIKIHMDIVNKMPILNNLVKDKSSCS